MDVGGGTGVCDVLDTRMLMRAVADLMEWLVHVAIAVEHTDMMHVQGAAHGWVQTRWCVFCARHVVFTTTMVRGDCSG